MSLDQYAFRFYNDDGGEATSTPYAAQNANITWPLDTNIRLRVGISHFGTLSPAGAKYMLFAALSGTNKWFEVAATGAGKIRTSISGGSPNNIPSGGVATTQRLTAPGYSPTPTFVPGRAWDGDSGQDLISIGNNQFTELEWCLQAVSANGAQNGDIYDFRVLRIPSVARRSTGAALAFGARTNSTFPAPAVIVDGDLLFAAFMVGDSASHVAVTPPSGFSLLSGFPLTYDNGTISFARLYLYSKVASGESGDYTFTHAAVNQGTNGLVICYSGQDATPFNPAPNTNTGTGAGPYTVAGITAANNNSMIIYVAANLAGMDTVVGPTGTTPVFSDVYDPGDPGLLFVADGVMAVAGATGDKEISLTASAGWGAALVALEENTA